MKAAIKPIMIIVIALVISGNINSQVPTAGLVGYYPFTGNSNDASPTANNGIVHGAVLAPDRFGTANACYRFDGVDDYISINNRSTYNFKSYTISLWFKYLGPSANTSQHWELINKNATRNSLLDPFSIAVFNPAKEPDNILHARAANGTIRVNTDPVRGQNYNQWHHVVILFDNNTNLFRLYLDGVRKTSNTAAFDPVINTSNINIGRWEGFLNYFNGLIDDIKLYNVALTESQIGTLYQAENSPSQTSLTTSFVKPTYLYNPNISAFQNCINLVQMKERFKTLPKISTTQKSGTFTTTGVTYYINKEIPPTIPASRTGTAQITSVANDLVVCKTTQIGFGKQFPGFLFLPTSINPSQSLIYPGALFKDGDIVRGVFSPQQPPRLPGFIDINVLNTQGVVSKPVQNFNDRTNVVGAINLLRTEVAESEPITDLDFRAGSFLSNSQINIVLESNTNINLAPIIEIPAEVAANNTGSFTFRNSLNLATAAIFQVYYIMTLGGEGPRSTISGSVPPDVVCVTDVLWGRMAFLTVGSYNSITEATTILERIVTVGIDENTTIGESDSRLDASAKFALDNGFVRLKIIGGSVANAVTVRDIPTFIRYIEEIKATVAGVNASPIAYTLRYAADNTEAKIGSFVSTTSEECFRADQLKVTLTSIKATKVVDFGNEELYGSVTIGSIGKVHSGTQTLWSVSNSSPIQASENNNIIGSSAPTVTFNLNPATTSAESISIGINIKDKIMPSPDPEYLGATATAKKDGYVQYSPISFNVSLSEIRSAPNGILNKPFLVSENDAKVEVRIRFELIRSTSVAQ